MQTSAPSLLDIGIELTDIPVGGKDLKINTYFDYDDKSWRKAEKACKKLKTSFGALCKRKLKTHIIKADTQGTYIFMSDLKYKGAHTSIYCNFYVDDEVKPTNSMKKLGYGKHGKEYVIIQMDFTFFGGKKPDNSNNEGYEDYNDQIIEQIINICDNPTLDRKVQQLSKQIRQLQTDSEIMDFLAIEGLQINKQVKRLFDLTKDINDRQLRNSILEFLADVFHLDRISNYKKALQNCFNYYGYTLISFGEIGDTFRMYLQSHDQELFF